MLLSTYCDPPLSWTSQWQQLQELYVTSCAALNMKPNNQMASCLYALAKAHKSPKEIKSLDISPFFLGRRGILPALSIVRHCESLEELSLNSSGIDDFSCSTICAALAEHNTLWKVDLRGNAFTGESLQELHKLGNAWRCRMANKTSTTVSILVDEGVGITKATCSQLADWSQTAEKVYWGHSIVCRDKVSLLEKRASLRSKKHSEEFSTDLRKMKQRLRMNDYMSRSVPSGTLQFTNDRWLIISVFISCAYNEFHDEANLIHRIIFPRANWKLRTYRVYLVPVMLHSTLNEYYQPNATVEADGREPLDYTRLPAFRKGLKHFNEDKAGRRHGILFNEEGCHSSEVRSLLIHNCDAFVGLCSDMFDPSIQLNDFDCVKGLGVPIMTFKRKASGIPVEFSHLHDYRRQLVLHYAAQNANLNGRSFGARNPKAVENDIEDDFSRFKIFEEKVRKSCGTAYFEYEAPYSRVYRGGERRCDIDELFVEVFITNLVSLGHTYLSRREGGSSPNATVFDVTEEQSRLSRRLPQIVCRNWGRLPAEATYTKSLVDSIVAPFKTEEEILRLKHGVIQAAPPVADIKVDGLEEVTVVKEPVIEKPFCAIVGEAGTGKSTQLRAIASSISQDRLASIAKHSVIHGKPTLLATMVSILQQFYRRYSEAGGSVFNEFVSATASESELVQAFCNSLHEAPMINEFSNRICLFIDDDDLLDKSFARLFLDNPHHYDMLQKAAPSQDCKVQIFFTTSRIDNVKSDLLTVHSAPTFTESQAADLFCHFAVGSGEVHPRMVEKAMDAAKRIAFTKRHGTRPLYVYLAAREVAYYLESTPVSAIVEVLPETVEELAATAMKVALPPDLECFFEALSSAPEPFSGSMLRFGLCDFRQYPYFTEKTSDRYRWCTPRTWGRITEALPSSSGTIAICNANFCHLFEHCYRGEGSGFLTNRWSKTKYNIWRHPWKFSHRTVFETAKRIFAPQSQTYQQFWARPLRRLAYLRDGPFAARALSNIVDPSYMLGTPHRIFTLMNAKAYDEMLLLLTSLQRVISPTSPFGAQLSELSNYFSKYWPILKRHRSFMYSCPEEAPASLKELVYKAYDRNSCARVKHCSSIPIAITTEVNHTTALKSSQLKAVCVAYRTLVNVKPHEVTASMVAKTNSNGFGKAYVFTSSPVPVIYEPHQSAICAVEIMEDTTGSRIATAALYDTKVQLAVVANGGATLVASITLDFLPKGPLRLSVSAWNSTLLQRSNSLMDFPMVAYGDKNVLAVVERHGTDAKPRTQRFDGHSNFIVSCGFSPAGCKVFSIDTTGSCMLWGAPEGPFSGNIIAVTKFNSIPKEARMIDHVTLLYTTTEGVFTWNAETSHVTKVTPFFNKKEVGDRYAVSYDSKSKWPNAVAWVDTAERLIQWNSPPTSDTDAAFTNCEYLRIQEHASTTDSIGNKEIESWRWRFGSRYAVGYDTKEHMIKLFHRAARRQVPLFFALPDLKYLAPSKFTDDPATSEPKDVPVFREISNMLTIGDDDQHIILCDTIGLLHILEYVDGPMLYPSDPFTLE